MHTGAAPVPSWGIAERAHNGRVDPPRGVEFASGWPLRAFWCELEPDHQRLFCFGKVTVAHGGWILTTGYGKLKYPSWPSVTRVIPFRPHWPGLALNTLLFAALWWSTIHLAGRAFRGTDPRARRRRGLCPRCGYDLKFHMIAGCPECGWNRPAHETSQKQSTP